VTGHVVSTGSASYAQGVNALYSAMPDVSGGACHGRRFGVRCRRPYGRRGCSWGAGRGSGGPSGGVRYHNCLNACPGARVQPPRSLPFFDALLREPADCLDLLAGASCIRGDRSGDVPGQKAAGRRSGTVYRHHRELVICPYGCGFWPA
jgi:hypothetical protein